MSRVGKRGEPYTQREADVAALLHLSNKQIAARLNVSGDTVRKHVSNVLRKAGVDRRSAVPDPRVKRLLDAVDGAMVVGTPEAMLELARAREAFR